MRTTSFLAAGAAYLCILAAASVAQDRSKYPTHLNASASGIDWIAFYDRIDSLTGEARQALPHHRDIPYGDYPKQKLDLYLSENPGRHPVFVFIHGGGFVEGDRAHYGYVARPLAVHGIITVVMSYRLSPAHYPDQVHDVQAALDWVYHNIERYGGDASRIYIGGHSAGAILSAFVSVNAGWLSAKSLPEDLIKGFVPISGPYDLRSPGGFVDNYFADDTLRTEASPVLNIRNTAPRAVVAVGSLESAYVASSENFVNAFRVAGGEARLLVLEGEGHDDTALSAADRDGPLVRALVALINSSE